MPKLATRRERHTTTGPIILDELGPEFDRGERVAGKVTLKLGRNLHQDRHGTIHAVTVRWELTVVDWVLLTLVGVAVFAAGVILGDRAGRFTGDVWAVVAVAVACVVGWVARIVWHRHRRRRVR